MGLSLRFARRASVLLPIQAGGLAALSWVPAAPTARRQRAGSAELFHP
jgi:hypothetical protein